MKKIYSMNEIQLYILFSISLTNFYVDNGQLNKLTQKSVYIHVKQTNINIKYKLYTISETMIKSANLLK